MVDYSFLWLTMKKKHISCYYLRTNFNISSGTIKRLKKNESVSTNTLESLCRALECPISEIITIC